MPIKRLVALAALTGAVACPAIAADSAFPPATPESQGMSAQALEQLSDVVRAYVEKDYAVGAEFLVIKSRRTVLHEVYGSVDRDEKRPWTVGTICNIRSMTKPLTGVAAQILVERGLVGLDDPIANHLSGFDTDASRSITLRQVLAHRSGLPLTILTTVDEYSDLVTQANAAGARGPEFEPESKFWYSDIGTDVVGAMVEVVSGRPLDDFVIAEILEPLGMADTFYYLDAADPRAARVASLYVGTANAWARFWAAGSGPFYPFAWGSQTLYSTPLDYARFLAMWMDEGRVGEERLLAPETVRRILRPVSEMSMLGSDERYPTEFAGLETYYGQMSLLHCRAGDLESTPVVIGHSGSDGTAAWAWPERDLMVLYFTQSRGGTTVLRLEEAIERLLLHPGRPSVVEDVPERYAPYLGTYVANFGSFENEAFTVKMKGGRLALDIPSQLVFELLDPDDAGADVPWAFAMAPDQVTVTFERNDQGEVVLLELHQSGSTFVVPRRGTPLADELSAEVVVSAETMQSLVGDYEDQQSAAIVTVFITDDRALGIKAPPDIILQLRPTREADRWQVKQSPAVALSFQRDEDGRVVSMTRHIAGQTLVMPRFSTPPPPPVDDPEP